MAAPKTRSSTAISTYQFPLDDTLTQSTTLRFVEYSRENPEKAVPTTTTSLIVQLPIPATITESNRLRINGTELGLLGNFSGAGNPDFSKIQDLENMLRGQSWSDYAANALKFIALTPGFSDTKIALATSRYFGLLRNPHVTALFEGVDLRPWSFSWKFSPRNEAESVALNNIIKRIKQRIYPKTIIGGYALNYPDQVYINFNGTNEYIDTVRKSFVTDLSITKGGAETAFFTSGDTVETYLNLSVMEVDIITRDELTT